MDLYGIRTVYIRESENNLRDIVRETLQCDFTKRDWKVRHFKVVTRLYPCYLLGHVASWGNADRTLLCFANESAREYARCPPQSRSSIRWHVPLFFSFVLAFASSWNGTIGAYILIGIPRDWESVAGFVANRACMNVSRDATQDPLRIRARMTLRSICVVIRRISCNLCISYANTYDDTNVYAPTVASFAKPGQTKRNILSVS